MENNRRVFEGRYNFTYTLPMPIILIFGSYHIFKTNRILTT